MQTIYFIERNGIPMYGTARATKEEAIQLRNKLQQQCATDRFYDPNDVYTVSQTATDHPKKRWNDALLLKSNKEVLLWNK